MIPFSHTRAQRAFRICRLVVAKYADAGGAFSGEGGLRHMGRWHIKGRMVYTSDSVALATLEMLVNMDLTCLPQLALFAVDVPESLPVAVVRPNDLPAAWRQAPAPLSLQQAGQAWLEDSRTALLQVPSAVVPQESNFLLNPLHKDFEQLHIHQIDYEHPDKRLLP